MIRNTISASLARSPSSSSCWPGLVGGRPNELGGKQGNIWVCLGCRSVNTTGSGKPGWSVAQHVRPAMGIVWR